MQYHSNWEIIMEVRKELQVRGLCIILHWDHCYVVNNEGLPVLKEYYEDIRGGAFCVFRAIVACIKFLQRSK